MCLKNWTYVGVYARPLSVSNLNCEQLGLRANGRTRIAGYVASKLKLVHPEIEAKEEEMEVVEGISWVQALSEDGLTVPSLQWRNWSQIPYTEFSIFIWDLGFHHNINPCVRVLERFSNSLVKNVSLYASKTLKKVHQNYVFRSDHNLS